MMKVRLRHIPRLIQKRIIQYPVATILLVLVFIYIGAASVIAISENIDIAEALVKALPAFFGELGEVESGPLVARLSIIVALLSSIGFLAVITAKITASFVEFVRRGGSMAKKISLSGHTIICGWNFQGPRIVHELLSGLQKREKSIVILVNSDERPIRDEHVEFVRGDPTQDTDLIRAGINAAGSVIVLSDLTKSANESDAETLMVVLAVETLNRRVHTCAQIVNSANRIHLERAHADEIICLDQLGGCLAVASAINHGSCSIIEELLTFNRGCEFYRYDGPIPDYFVGVSYTEAVKMLIEKGILLIAIETDNTEELRQQLSHDVIHIRENVSRALVVNPQSQYNLCKGDALFLIAESKPKNL